MRVLCSILLLLLLNSVSWAQERRPNLIVDDKAKLFSDKAVMAANATVSSIDNKNLFYDIIIETCDAPKIPANVKDNPSKLQDYLNDWARANHKLRKVNGVYIAITKDPTYVVVQVTADLYEEFKAITDADMAQWKTTLERQVAAKEYDVGLKEIVKTANAKLQNVPKGSKSSAKERKKDEGSRINYWVLGLIAIIVPMIVRVGMGVLAVTKIKKPAPGTRAPDKGTVFMQGMLGAALSEKLLGKPKKAATTATATASSKPAPSAVADDNSPFAAAPASKAPAAKAAAPVADQSNPFAAAPAAKPTAAKKPAAPVADESNPFAAAPASKAPAAKTPAAKPAASIADDSNPFAAAPASQAPAAKKPAPKPAAPFADDGNPFA